MTSNRENLEDLVSRFQPVSLAGMDSVKLMTRNDRKYICRLDQLPELLGRALPYFHILENNSKRIHGYKTTYWDTPDFEMYRKHHDGKLNRFKVRVREYTDTKDHFLEVKFRTNKRITIKKRIPVSARAVLAQKRTADFIFSNSGYLAGDLEKKLSSSFERMTLACEEPSERVTIDINPSWHSGNLHAALPNISIIEVKFSGSNPSEGFGKILRDYRVLPYRISKYCTGTTLLFPDIKHNRFKAKILHLTNLENSSIHAESPY